MVVGIDLFASNIDFIKIYNTLTDIISNFGQICSSKFNKTRQIFVVSKFAIGVDNSATILYNNIVVNWLLFIFCHSITKQEVFACLC